LLIQLTVEYLYNIWFISVYLLETMHYSRWQIQIAPGFINKYSSSYHFWILTFILLDILPPIDAALRGEELLLMIMPVLCMWKANGGRMLLGMKPWATLLSSTTLKCSRSDLQFGPLECMASHNWHIWIMSILPICLVLKTYIEFIASSLVFQPLVPLFLLCASILALTGPLF